MSLVLASCGAASERGTTSPAPLPAVRIVAQTPTAPADRDNDGRFDADDACPSEPEDCDAFTDADGCPDPDNDRDRVLDVCDACPNEPETYNDLDDDDGCPDAAARVIIQSTKQETRVMRGLIRIITRIYFARGAARLRPNVRSTLDDIAAVMRQSPQIVLVATLGRAGADERGALALSQRRAEAVRRALVSRGVAAERLVAYGIGTVRPVGGVPEVERSVELVVMRSDSGELFRWTGTDVESTLPPEPVRLPAAIRPACVPAAPATRGTPCAMGSSTTDSAGAP